jgi:hypothetical protein
MSEENTKIKQNIITKNTCLKKVHRNTTDIHPLLNYSLTMPNNIKNNEFFVIPYVSKNIILFNKQLDSCDQNITNNSMSSDLNFGDTLLLNEKKNETSNAIKNININNSMNFSFPINSNNFLDIIFGITNITQLTNWFIGYNIEDKKTINLVISLFWENYYETINDNMNEFNHLNTLIAKLLFSKKLTSDESIKISNKLISENYGKKIKYLEKIKKYIDEI